MRVGAQSEQVIYPTDPGTSVYNIAPVYAIRFKGTSQYAAYRWESCRIADNPLERYFSIKIKALPADSELTVDDVADNASFWRDGFIEFKFPTSGLYTLASQENVDGGVCSYSWSSTLWEDGQTAHNLSVHLPFADVNHGSLVNVSLALRFVKVAE